MGVKYCVGAEHPDVRAAGRRPLVRQACQGAEEGRAHRPPTSHGARRQPLLAHPAHAACRSPEEGVHDGQGSGLLGRPPLLGTSGVPRTHRPFVEGATEPLAARCG